MLLPLDPATTMLISLFEELRPSTAKLPDLSLASFSFLLTEASKLSCMVLPG